MTLSGIFFYGIGLLLLYIIGKILLWPMKKILKLIGNGILGGITLLLFNLIGGVIGIPNLAVSPVNAIIVGFLGVPGVVLLLIINISK